MFVKGDYRIIQCPIYNQNYDIEHREIIGTMYVVQVKGWFFWHDIKSFVSDNDEYSRRCAEELFEKLKEEI